MSSVTLGRAMLAACVAAMLAPGLARAATKTEAQAALAAARKAEAAAGAVRNRWLPAEAALKQAAQALAAGQYDGSVAISERARALANRSIQQAKEQEGLWQNEVIR